ncbi:MAG: sulfatase-like hydrolase/transferase [Planctomycetota bacterium]
MRRWRFVGILALVVVFVVGFSWWSLRRPQWNVLVVTLDTTRADHLGCYGHDAARTPALDALAASGVLFERAYATAPLTLPSHATMFTGLYPPEHGLRTNGQSRLADSIPTLAETLAARGYATGGFVASFVLDSKFGLDRGFSSYGDDMSGSGPADHALHRYRPGNLVVDEALEWLNGNAQRPFLCWVHLYDPHSPYLSHPDLFGEEFKARPYDGEMTFVDRQLGRLQNFLKQRGIADRTLIVVIGDHGEGLDEHHERTHGKMLYNSTMQVPLILSQPGILPAGRRVAESVSLVDVFPTILDALQISLRSQVSGRSLLAAARGGTFESHLCYGETDEPFHEAGWSPLRSLTTDRWKYIRAPRKELYDLAKDRGELNNLASNNVEQTALLDRQLTELEGKMAPRHEVNIQLSPREQRVLASLGYVGNAKADAPPVSHATLPDIKDMMVHFNELDDARGLLETGSVDEAIKALRKLVAAAPDYELAQVILGDALTHQKQFDAAVAQFRSVLKHNPESEMAYAHLGDTLAAQGKFVEALKNYQEAVKRDPDSDGLQYNLGRTLSQMGQVGEAIPHFRAALELDPGFANAYVELGTALLREGRADEALENYQTAIKLNQESLHAYLNAATVFASRAQFVDAMEYLQRAEKLDPKNASIQYSLGAVSAAQGFSNPAIQHLKAAISLQPDYPAARELLEQLSITPAPGN